ncbi:hypothetical protein DL766_001620 [Monosporascus sp. MC13-8B]|uniref:FAD-binding PCMH-type domain-containing protein n=1 Tax=Monosporascus cannonballus TaxID=155416 RepID=A0ABY0HDW5_9PEZI|nr:hypothetical protein DL762_002476 [Monosporascus cannonballus]RYO98942.1 hypothetical protein DL763_001852 [Monosporascus cannonballus]RYP37151.1 hypothetical protein DL766_001620 [Monosporascus sp. MC13-8B]
MSALQGGVQVDLHKFNRVQFDAEDGLLTVGGSTTFSQLIDPLYKSGAQFPLGTAYCVGVVGATLGAGVSASQGYAGLLSDLLEEVQLVTATGNLVTTSRSQNKDLFWAIRGAGANFGIVTSAKYRVPDTVNNGDVINANFLFLMNRALEVFTYLSSLDEEISEYLALNIAIFFDPKIDQIVLLVNVNFAGPARAAAPFLESVAKVGPLRSEVLNVRWPDVFSTSYFGIKDTKACSRNQNVNMRSIGAKRTDPEAWVAFLHELENFSRAHPDVTAAMVIHRFATQKVLGVPDGDSAYPHRQLKMHIQLETVYENQALDNTVDAFLDSARHNFTAASGFDKPAVYVNFAHGDEGPEAWYGSHNQARLGQLKQEWDPRGLFSFYNAIPPIGPSDHELR